MALSCVPRASASRAWSEDRDFPSPAYYDFTIGAKIISAEGPSFTSMQRTSVRQRRRDQKATSLVSTFEVSDGCLFIGQGATHGQSNRDLSTMDNRFSTMTEVRRVAWPAYETTEWDEMQFMQGIAGTLELFHRSTIEFQRVVGEVTGQPVAVFQRIDQAGYKLPIDDRVLDDTDTLMVFGLDHLVSEQEAAREELAAIREWLKREGICLLLGPHHVCGIHHQHGATTDGIHSPWRRTRPTPALWTIHAFDYEGSRCTSYESIRTAPCGLQRQ
jgi:hypothetical protein